MKYRDLRAFISRTRGRKTANARLTRAISPRLEMTALARMRFFKRQARPCISTKPAGYKIPVLANLFGTPRRVAMGMGADERCRAPSRSGQLLANLKEPTPPKGLKDAGQLLGMAKALWDMKPSLVRKADCQQVMSRRQGGRPDDVA